MGPGTEYSKAQPGRVDDKFSLQELTYLHKGETPTDVPLEPFAASSLNQHICFISLGKHKYELGMTVGSMNHCYFQCALSGVKAAI